MQTMDGIFTNLKRTFQSGNILSKLIYINVIANANKIPNTAPEAPMVTK